MKVTPERMAEIIKNEKEIRDMAAVAPPIPLGTQMSLAWSARKIRKLLRQLLLALLLLCGTAQACDKKAAVINIDTTAHTKFIHKRFINPDDWCVGRVDTTWHDLRYSWQGDRWALVDDWQDLVVCYGPITSIDTTWVLCCDSAARGLRDPFMWDSTWWANNGPFSPRQSPERWYIESVDTLAYFHIDTIHSTGWCNDNCLQPIIDTTWAKKIPLSEVWLMPESMWKLRQLLKGFWVNGRWATPEEADKHLHRFDDK